MEVILNKTPKHMEKGLDLAGKPLTPRSERPRSTYGSLLMTIQDSQGLCSAGRKCVRHENHAGKCWPE